MLKLPFIVSKEFLENPIFAYNLIEDLVFSRKNHKTFKTIKSVFLCALLEEVEIVLAIVQKIKGLIYKKKSKLQKVIPINNVIKLKCRDNIKFDSKIKSVFFRTIAPEASDTLEIEEYYETITKSMTPH